jgi:hypothetical protein
MMKLLDPQKNFTLSKHAAANAPYYPRQQKFRIVTTSGATEFNQKRRSDFSFAVMDMLFLSPPMKLSLLQECNLNLRLKRILQYMEQGKAFLQSELQKKNNMNAEEFRLLIRDAEYEASQPSKYSMFVSHSGVIAQDPRISYADLVGTQEDITNPNQSAKRMLPMLM